MNHRTPSLGLQFHHSVPPNATFSLRATVETGADGGLRFDYRLRANPADLLIPPPAPARHTDFLWQHTCFEVFLAVEGEPGYREFNFSPSGAWAMYTFARYRIPLEPTVSVRGDPSIRSGWAQGELLLSALISPADLPPRRDGAALELGLCAVIEEADGKLSYWALRHHPDRPDFHARDGLALRLPAETLRYTEQREATS